jgi:hypothetical protein
MLGWWSAHGFGFAIASRLPVSGATSAILDCDRTAEVHPPRRKPLVQYAASSEARKTARSTLRETSTIWPVLDQIFVKPPSHM